jgi:hypothetical protein
MADIADRPRPIARVSPETLTEIRSRALEEIAHALVAGADVTTLQPMAALIVGAPATARQGV